MKHANVNEKRLVETFLRLARIDGVCGEERGIADAVTEYLDSLGIFWQEDDAGSSFNGNAGNIFARVPGKGNSQRPLLLMAHLDTVDHTAALQPVIEKGSIRSGGDTILGADDRVGVAVILEALMSLSGNGREHRPLEIVFSVGEEKGMLGSCKFDFSCLRAQEGYILDCSRPPGQYVAVTPTAVDLDLRFKGRASHAGVAIENGVNALSMALEVLAGFPVGVVDAETTANIGTISGGSGVNVVPETVTAAGEIRSFNRDTISDMCARLKEEGKKAADKYGGSAEIKCMPAFTGFNLSEDLPVVKNFHTACTELGLTPKGLTYYGGSDANVVNKHTINAVNIGVGVKNPHSHNEEIAVRDMTVTAELIIKLTGI